MLIAAGWFRMTCFKNQELRPATCPNAAAGEGVGIVFVESEFLDAGSPQAILSLSGE